MWKALYALYDAICRGCTCKVEGYNQYGVFNQSIQDWFIACKPWSTIILIAIGANIGIGLKVTLIFLS